MVTGTKGAEYRTLIKRMPNTLRVGCFPGGDTEYVSIQAAINYAATQAPSATNPWTIYIYPGIYNEQVTCSSWVNLQGIGPKGSVVISQVDSTVLNLADNVEVADLTVRLVTPTIGQFVIYDSAAVTARLSNLVVEISTPAALGHTVFRCSFASTLTIEECSYNIGGTGAIFGIGNRNAAATVRLINNNFIFNNTSAYHIHSNQVGNWTGGGNRWAGTCGMFNVSLGTILFDGDRVDCSGGSTITGGSVCIKNGQQEYHVWAGMLIQHAIAAAAADTPTPAATAPYTVLIHPGIYTGTLTCSSWVNLKGIGPRESVVIYQVNAGGIITYAANMEVEGLIVRLGTPTAGYVLTSLNAVGTVALRDVAFEVTTPGAFAIVLVQVLAAGATMIMEKCFYNIGGTGASVGIWNGNNGANFHIINNDFRFSNTNAYHIASFVAGSWTGGGNRWAGTCGMFSVSSGTILFDGDRVDCSGGSTITGDSVCIKNGQQEYHVWAGMLIQHAITAAAADTPTPAATAIYTVLIHPGIYNEQVSCSTYVNLKGVGPKESVVIHQADNNVVRLATQVQLSDFTVRLGIPVAAWSLVYDSAVTCVARLTNLIFEITTPGAINSLVVVKLTGSGSNVTIENCSGKIGGTGAGCYFIENATSAATAHLLDNDVTFTNANGYMIHFTIAGSITGRGNRWAGTCAMFSVAAAAAITLDHDAILCTGTWSSILATIILRHCTIESTVTASGGVVRLKNCSYRAISRSGTGNIVDESPWLSDAPWYVVKWGAWMVALASMDVGTRGTPTDAGSGQILLEVTDNVAGQEAVETNPEAAGSRENAFTPSRTPRYIVQIVVDSFDAHVTMFFGLRETLGNAIPNIAAEECAGFDWNGTNFRAISSDGGGAGVATNLTTPSVNVQHQLEVIVIGGIQVEFYVDGVLVATHATAAGRPVTVLDWQHLLATAGAGGGDEIDVTVRNGGCQECPA